MKVLEYFVIQRTNNFYSSTDIIRMIKLRNIQWAGNVACTEKKKTEKLGWKDRRK
jgi:hypothetical protein